MKENLLKEAKNFDDLSNQKELYNSRNISDARFMYLLDLKQQLDKIK